MDQLKNSPLNCIVTHYENFELRNGKLYGTGTVIFKTNQKYSGEIDSSIIHGSGTYTWNDGVVYTGQFDNGRMTGTGKYSWPDGSWYSGEVLNGKKHGQGTYCDDVRFYFYIGQWKDDMKHGQGRLDCNAEGTWYYEGDWKSNKRHGKGIQHFDSGSKYNGEWENDMPNGWGSMYWKQSNQLYEGMWRQGVRHGHGEQYWLIEPTPIVCLFQHNMYKGDWVNDKRTGYGIFIYSDGAKFEGNWLDNKKHGDGTFFFKTGRKMKATFIEDVIVEKVGNNQRWLTTPLSEFEEDTVLLFCPDLAERLPQFDNYIYSDAEKQQLRNTILIKMSYLKSVYYIYSQLGRSESSISCGVLDGTQFMQMCRDMQLHNLGWSLGQIMSILNVGECRIDWPNKRLMPWKFTRKIIILAYHVFRNSKESKLSVVECFKKLFYDHIKVLKGTNCIGFLFANPIRTRYIMKYVDSFCRMYQRVCSFFNDGQNKKNATVRQFIIFIKDIRLMGLSNITTQNLVNIMLHLIPSLKQDDVFNFDLQICFLDFIDAVFACAESFYSDMTLEQSNEIFGIETVASSYPSTIINRKKSEDKNELDYFESTGSIMSRILTLQDQIPAQLLEIYREDCRLLEKTKDDYCYDTLPSQTPAELIERIRSHSVGYNGELYAMKYFSCEKIGDLTGDAETDALLLRVCHFLDNVFLPAVNTWMLITNRMNDIRDLEAEIAAVESFSNIVLPHSTVSTVWFDES